MSTAQAPAINMDKLNSFIGQFVSDLGASVHAGMVVIGEKLGLYKALAEGPVTASELAAKTKTDERYLREWLGSQAAGGYVTYEEDADKFSLTKLALPICLARSSWHWDRWPPFRALRSPSAPALVWAGTSTSTASSTAARNSSAPATLQTWSAHGSRH